MIRYYSDTGNQIPPKADVTVIVASKEHPYMPISYNEDYEYNEEYLYFIEKKHENYRIGDIVVVTKDVQNFCELTHQGGALYINDNYKIIGTYKNRSLLKIHNGRYTYTIPSALLHIQKKVKKFTKEEIFNIFDLNELPEINVEVIQQAKTFEEIGLDESTVLELLLQTHVIAKNYLNCLIENFSNGNVVQNKKEDIENTDLSNDVNDAVSTKELEDIKGLSGYLKEVNKYKYYSKDKLTSEMLKTYETYIANTDPIHEEE